MQLMSSAAKTAGININPVEGLKQLTVETATEGVDAGININPVEGLKLQIHDLEQQLASARININPVEGLKQFPPCCFPLNPSA